MTPSPARSVLIVGGGVAGVSTAAALRKGGFDGDVTIVDSGDMPYDRPPLSKGYLAGAQDLQQIALQRPEWYDEQSVRLLNRTRATALRPSEGSVLLSDGNALQADRIVLATGGRASRPPIPGAEDHRVHVLRDVEDADRLRAALVPGARVLVVGAGLIGAEVASTAIAMGCDVTLADPVPYPLSQVLGKEVAGWIHGWHTEQGITVVCGGVASLESADGALWSTLSGVDSPVPADVVVLGVGMTPETRLAEEAGLDVGRGVLVDRRQVTSHPHVLAVGDPARLRTDATVHPLAEHWEAAQLDGQRAAAAILGTDAPAEVAPWFWTDRHHRHVEVVGSLAEADRIVIRGSVDDQAFSAFGFVGSHVTGAVAVDDSNAVRAARRMIDRKLAVEPDVIADPDHDLRRLLRG